MDQPSSDLLGFETLPPDDSLNAEQPNISSSFSDPKNTMHLVHEQVESVSQMSESRRQSLAAEPTITVIDVVRAPEQSPNTRESRRRSSISMNSPRRMSTMQIKSRKSVYEVIWRENETPSRPSTPVQGEALFGKPIREESAENDHETNADDGVKADIGKAESTVAIGSEAPTPHFSQPTWGARPKPKQLRIVTGNEIATVSELCESPSDLTPAPEIKHHKGFKSEVNGTKDGPLVDPTKPIVIMVPGRSSNKDGTVKGQLIKIAAEAEDDGGIQARRGSDTPERRGSWLSVKERISLAGWDGRGGDGAAVS